MKQGAPLKARDAGMCGDVLKGGRFCRSWSNDSRLREVAACSSDGTICTNEIFVLFFFFIFTEQGVEAVRPNCVALDPDV